MGWGGGGVGTLDADRDQQLAEVAHGVLGGVHEQAEGGRRESGAADVAGLAEGALVGGAELGECMVDLAVEGVHQGGDGGRVGGAGGRCHAFGGEGGELGVGERLAARVGQQAVEDAGEVLQVEAGGGDAAGAGPEQGGGELAGQGVELGAGLQEGVGDGLQQRGDAVDRAAEPDLGGVGGAHGSAPGGAVGAGMAAQ